MDNKKLLKLASFIPILAFNFNLTLADLSSQFGFVKTVGVVEAINLEKENNKEALILQSRAQAIDAYFSIRNMPLAGYGLKMVEEAQKHNLDWRLLPAISVQESGGGKHATFRCKNNPFGWASCNVKFESIDEAIEVVALNLSGKNPKTEKYYKDNEIKEKLYFYNGTVVSHYPQTILSIMDKFDTLNE